MTGKTHDHPSDVAAEQGVVIVDGPDGVAVTFTPKAAVETSERLLEGGITAQGQRINGKTPPEEDREDED
jgi:hypothetical protein